MAKKMNIHSEENKKNKYYLKLPFYIDNSK